jgi:hypothetical protein
MKLYDLKLKEIQVLEKKIAEERQRLQKKVPGKPRGRTHRLKQKLKKEQLKVHKTVKEVVGHHKALIVLFICNS